MIVQHLKERFVPKKNNDTSNIRDLAISKFLDPFSFFITSPIYLMPRGPTPSGLSILSYRIKCASTYHSLQCSLLFVTCDVLLITSSKTFSSVSSSLVNFPMAEQAQSDAGDLDGLHDGPQDAPQDPAKPPTQEQYTRLLKELNEPDTPPQRRQSTAPAPAGTRQATTGSVTRHPNSIRRPNCPNAAGLQAPKHPTRASGPGQKPQPPSPKF